jgi:hypothetical protein
MIVSPQPRVISSGVGSGYQVPIYHPQPPVPQMMPQQQTNFNVSVNMTVAPAPPMPSFNPETTENEKAPLLAADRI